jgi:tRNA-Thr(GGU) m(6)t(6)A37 methyltransferase TsaA
MKYEVVRTGYIYLVIIVSLIIVLTGVVILCPNFKSKKDMKHRTFTLYQIGEITKDNGRTFITINEEYKAGLKGSEQFPELTVIYWFDQNDNPEKRTILQVHPRGNPENPIRGVFTTHSPFRPNLIAISRVKILSINENVIEIEEIDAYNHSPVLDLKN